MKVLKEYLSSGVAVLTLRGEFDSFVTNAFSGVIQSVIDEGYAKVVLNMRLVKFVNSTGLGAMIKGRKHCKEAKGDLVVSQPSAAVREAMESLGLDRLFSLYDDDEAAVAAFDESATQELTESAESTVMIHVPDGKPLVARLAKLEKGGLECKLASNSPDLVHGRELRLKFRLPLYRKEWFDPSARVESVSEDGGQCLVTMRFTQISDDDEQAIANFLDDMDDLRDAARGAS